MGSSPCGVSLTNSKEVCPEDLITTERDPGGVLVLTRQKSKLLHQIITDVLCTDGYCRLCRKGKAAVKIKHSWKANTFISVLIQRWNLNQAQLP